MRSGCWPKRCASSRPDLRCAGFDTESSASSLACRAEHRRTGAPSATLGTAPRSRMGWPELLVVTAGALPRWMRGGSAATGPIGLLVVNVRTSSPGEDCCGVRRIPKKTKCVKWRRPSSRSASRTAMSHAAGRLPNEGHGAACLREGQGDRRVKLGDRFTDQFESR